MLARDCVEAGEFLSDLLERISVLPIEMPPLGRRREDVPLLISHFLEQAKEPGTQDRIYTPEAIAALATTGWQLHVYGTLGARLSDWCASRLAVYAFAWEPAHETAGFSRDGMYLVRPDAYVALAATEQDPALIERYLAERDMQLAPAG